MNSSDENDNKSAEDKAFFPIPNSVEGIDGATIVVPRRLNWKKQKLVLGIFQEMIAEAGLEVKIQVDPIALSRFIFSLFAKNTHRLTTITSIIIDKDTDWVDENLDYGRVTSICVPFCLTLMQEQMQVVMGALAQVKSLSQVASGKKKNS